MMTEYKGVYSIVKRCFKHLNHQIEIKANELDDEIFRISVCLTSRGPVASWAIWHVLSEELRIHRSGEGIIDTLGVALPYFEPDLSNYPKLLDKLKTYMVFS